MEKKVLILHVELNVNVPYFSITRVQLKKLFYKYFTILLFATYMASCGPDGGGYSYDNPYDPVYNDQPETIFVNISSPSKRRDKAEKNPVTLIWNGLDNDGSISDYSYKMDDGEWIWTSASFIEYTGLGTGSHTFYVKARDNVGATDLSPAEISFEVDATPPSVSFTNPRHNSGNVSVNSSMTATFSELMDKDSIVALSSFELRDGFSLISGTLDYDYSTLNFKADLNLNFNTQYTATIIATATDEVGNSLPSQYSWSFTTGTGPDTIEPTVTSTFPVRDAQGVSIDSSITATFTEPMLASTINLSSFKINDGTSDVNGTVSYSGLTATFIPYSSLSHDVSYIVTITTAVKDLANPSNNMPAEYSWSFTTGSEPDTTAPMVSSTSPLNGEVDVSPNSAIIATFSEPVDSSTITTASFTVLDAIGDDVPGSVYYSGVTAAFMPHTALAYSYSYTARINTDVFDTSGNPIISDYLWNFVTGPEPDTTQPTVSSTVPKRNSSGVAVNAAIAATFSEKMDAYTISTATFTLRDNDKSSNVSGAVTYGGATATFTPYTLLDFATSYTATIASNVMDIAANNMQTDYSWSFETGSEPDTVSPVVMWVTPFENATCIDIDTVVTATFSEAVDPSTITTGTFKLEDYSNGTVSGAVSLIGTTAIFTPYTSLSEGENYSAIITTNVKDSSGNSLSEEYSWNFTTGYLPDITPPSVLSVMPSYGATDIPYDASVIVSFSEPLNVSTMNTDSFILHNGTDYVDGNVYYDGDLVAIFTPFSSLAFDTLYTITITTDIKDVAGNSILDNYSSVFTTSNAPDVTPPEVLLTDPFNGETDVPVDDPRIFIVFNEPMDASTITTATIELFNENTATIAPGNVYFDGVLTALFKPLSDFAYDTEYTIIVKTGVKDLAGIPLAVVEQRTFTTGLVPINIASSISGGSYHSLAIKNDLTAWAWGENTDGQLGDSSTVDSPSPVQVSTISGVSALAAGDAHSIAILDDESVWTWGDNVIGQLGIGSFDNSIHSTPVKVDSLSNILAVAAGSFHSLALRDDGTVWAWGNNSDGQLGEGTTDDRNLPIKVVDPGDLSGYLSDIVAIACGENHSLAIKSNGTVWAWGWNNTGQLGDGTTINSLIPVQVVGLSNVVAVAAGTMHTIALKSNGAVWSWGWNFFGQLGDGTNDDRLAPVLVADLSDVESLSAGSFHSTAMNGGNVWAWGRNSYGQLGDGSTNDSVAPVQVLGLSGVTAIAGGYRHSLALKGNGTAWTWGDNSSGQLGYDTAPDDYSNIPGKLNW